MQLILDFDAYGPDLQIRWNILGTPMAQQWAKNLQLILDDQREQRFEHINCVDDWDAERYLDRIKIFGQKYFAGRYDRVTLDTVGETTLSNAFTALTEIMQVHTSDKAVMDHLKDVARAVKNLRYWISKRRLREFGVIAHGNLRMNFPQDVNIVVEDPKSLNLTTNIQMGGIYARVNYKGMAWNHIEMLAELRGTTRMYEDMLRDGVGGVESISTSWEALFEPDIIGLDANLLMACEIFPNEMRRLGYTDPVEILQQAGKLQVAELAEPYSPSHFSRIVGLKGIRIE